MSNVKALATIVVVIIVVIAVAVVVIVVVADQLARTNSVISNTVQFHNSLDVLHLFSRYKLILFTHFGPALLSSLLAFFASFDLVY